MSSNLKDLIIWPRHLYTVPYAGKVGYCARGSRAWFAAHGIDWAHFVAHGVPADVLAATGDPLALAVIQHAKTEGFLHGREK